ncbi:MAG: GNAT family N-acetyltransferase [Candidatus Aquilonibacter sp.]
MTVEIQRGNSPAFYDLIAEYETALPPELRHATLEPFVEAFMASLDGQPCGCLALDERDATTGIVKRLYVKPTFRGHGVARRLMDDLLAAARERGYTRVILDTNREQLAAAYKLYLSMGFTEYAADDDGVEYACPTFMELQL